MRSHRHAWKFCALPLALLFLSIGWVTADFSAHAADFSAVSRGEYLARAGDCVACHASPDGVPFAGGQYMPTPFGQISVPNIASEKATGIGDWTDDQFYQAMRNGIGDKGEYLYPVFPFPWYTNVTRDDAPAINAYLFSLAPQNAARKPLKLTFPFNVREALLTWRTLFFRAADKAAPSSRGARIDRGRYLVEGLGHCG
jgi:mono/diheme cytochrome c family protein